MASLALNSLMTDLGLSSVSRSPCHLAEAFAFFAVIALIDLRSKIDATDLLSSSNATRDGSCKHDSPLAALSVRDCSCKHDSPLLPRFCVLPWKKLNGSCLNPDIG